MAKAYGKTQKSILSILERRGPIPARTIMIEVNKTREKSITRQAVWESLNRMEEREVIGSVWFDGEKIYFDPSNKEEVKNFIANQIM